MKVFTPKCWIRCVEPITQRKIAEIHVFGKCVYVPLFNNRRYTFEIMQFLWKFLQQSVEFDAKNKTEHVLNTSSKEK